MIHNTGRIHFQRLFNVIARKIPAGPLVKQNHIMIMNCSSADFPGSRHSPTGECGNCTATIPEHSKHRNGKPYLFWLSNAHANFMKAELEALLKLFNLSNTILDDGIWYGPMAILNFQSEEDAQKILSRSVLVHSCFELWASGSTMEELHSYLGKNLEVAAPYVQKSFRFRVDIYGKKVPHQEKVKIIDSFDYIPLDGPVELSNPECSLHLVQYFDREDKEAAENPDAVFFGRWIGDAQRDIISKISLKTRKFIGNTSMDPLLSLLMSNLAHVRQNSIVFDPFVGTGSLLIASALMGAYVLGTDIDYLMLHAKSKPSKARVAKRDSDESIFGNLLQYGVENRYIDVLIADASLPLFRTELRFDAIITDPPYGVRESTERIGSPKVDPTVPEEHLEHHFPQKIGYSLGDIFRDLLDFAAQRLHVGGRLVCWIPVARQFYNADHLPRNKCFRLVSNCEQTFGLNVGRRLLTYEKIAEPDETCKTSMEDQSAMYRFKFSENRIEREKKQKKQPGPKL